MIRWRNISVFLVPLVLLAVVQGCVSFVFFRDMPFVSDARAYHVAAIELLRGEYTDRAFYYPPGNTLLLAAVYTVFGTYALTTKITILVVNAATVLCVTGLALWISASRRTALVAGLLFAVYPPVVMLSGLPYSQHLAQLCLTAAVFSWLRAVLTQRLWLFSVCGICLGVGVLTRPSMLSIGMVMAATGLFAFWRAWHVQLRGAGHGLSAAPQGCQASAASRHAPLRLFAGSVLCLLAMAAVMAPVMAFNAAQGAGWTLSTNNERNLFLGNNPHTPWYKTAHLGQRPLHELAESEQDYLEPYYSLPEQQGRRAMAAAAWKYIRQRPVYFVLQTLNRVRAFWGFDYIASRRIQIWQGWGTAALFALVGLEAGGYAVIMLMALVGILDAGRVKTADSVNEEETAPARRFNFVKWSIVAFVFAYQSPYAIAFSAGVYHFPLMSLLMPYAAMGGLQVWRNWLDPHANLFSRPLLTWLAFSVFLLIQAEYTWYSWKHF
jgi:hypothetical protein